MARRIQLSAEAVHVIGLLVRNLRADYDAFDKSWYIHSDEWKKTKVGKEADEWLDELKVFIQMLEDFPPTPKGLRG